MSEDERPAMVTRKPGQPFYDNETPEESRRRLIPLKANDAVLAGRRSSRYIEQFFGLRCAPDLMVNGLVSNAKELTESMAAFWAVMKHSGFDPQDREVGVVVPGDGITPRTAAMFAFRTRWSAWSIDPLMRRTDYPIDRLTCIRATVQDAAIPPMKRCALVFVHSHAMIPDALERIEAEEAVVVSIPCCVDQWVKGALPDKEYVDRGIWSPKRSVLVWKLASVPR